MFYFKLQDTCNAPLVTPGVNGAVEMTLFVFCIVHEIKAVLKQ